VCYMVQTTSKPTTTPKSSEKASKDTTDPELMSSSGQPPLHDLTTTAKGITSDSSEF